MKNISPLILFLLSITASQASQIGKQKIRKHNERSYPTKPKELTAQRSSERYQEYLKAEEAYAQACHQWSSCEMKLKNTPKKKKKIFEKQLQNASQQKKEKKEAFIKQTSSLGIFLETKKDYQGAEQYLRKAAEMTKNHYGENNIKTADAMEDLGLVYDKQNKYQEAKRCYEKVLKIKKNHPEIVKTLEKLACTAVHLDEYEIAKNYLEKVGIDQLPVRTLELLGGIYHHLDEFHKAKDCFERVLSLHPERASAMQGYGALLINLKQYAKAKNYLEKALKIKEEKEQEDILDRIMILEDLATAYKYLNEYKVAQQYAEQGLEICTEHLGKNHIKTADIRASLGNVLIGLNKYKKAKTELEKALIIKATQGKKDTSGIAAILGDLVPVCKKLNQYKKASQYREKAKPYIRQLRSHCMKYYDENPLATIDAMTELGHLLVAMEQYKEAKGYFKKTLTIKDEKDKNDTLGVDSTLKELIATCEDLSDCVSTHGKNVKIADAMERLGLIYDKQKRYPEAKIWYEKALKQKKNYEAIKTVKTLERLGRAALYLGNNQYAEQCIQKVLMITKKHYGEKHVETAEAMKLLGQLYDKLDNYKEAEKYVKDGLQIMQNLSSNNPIKIAGMAEVLGDLYDKQEKYPEAATYYEKALKIKKECENIETTTIREKLACVLAQLHQYKKAKKCLEGADSNQLTIASIKLLAWISHPLGDYNKVEEIFQRALELSTPKSIEAADVMSGYGNLLITLGKYEGAKTILKEALAINEEKKNGDTLRIATILRDLVIVCKRLKEYTTAIAYTKQVKPYIEKLRSDSVQRYGKNHIKTAATMVDMGGILRALGEYKKAENWFGNALKIYEVKSPERAAAMHGYGRVLISLEKYKEAKYYLEQALKGYEVKSPEKTDVMHGYGGMLIKPKKYSEKGVEIKKRTYNGNIFSIAKILKDLVMVCKELKQYKEAQLYAEKALQITEEYYGKDHIKTAATMTSLGSVLVERKEYRAAVSHFERSLKICNKKSPERADVMHGYGVLFIKLEKYEEARNYLEQAQSICREYYGKFHPKTADMMTSLGKALMKLGEEKDNKREQKKAKKDYLFARTYFEDAPDAYIWEESKKYLKIGDAMRNMMDVLIKLGQMGLAEVYCSGAEASYEEHKGDKKHMKIGDTLRNMMDALIKIGKMEKAEIYYWNAKASYEKYEGDKKDARIADINKKWADCYGKKKKKTSQIDEKEPENFETNEDHTEISSPYNTTRCIRHHLSLASTGSRH